MNDDELHRQRARADPAVRDARYLRAHWPQEWARQQERQREQRRQQRRERVEQQPEWASAQEPLQGQSDQAAAREASRPAAERSIDIHRSRAERLERWREERRVRENSAALEQSERRALFRQLELPPRQVHHGSEADRRANAAAAEAFFQRTWTSDEKARLRQEFPPHERARLWRRAEADAPVPLGLMERLEARVGNVQERPRLAGELYEEWLFRREMPELLARFGERHAKEVQLEVQMDQIGRKESGKSPLDEERQLLGRLEARVLEHDLSPEQRQVLERVRDRARAHRQEQLREIREHLHQAPVVQDLQRRLPNIIAEHRHLHEPGVRQELVFEEADRRRRGAAPLDVEREVTQRVAARVIQHDLAPRDRETLKHLRAARAQQARSREGREPSRRSVESRRQERGLEL